LYQVAAEMQDVDKHVDEQHDDLHEKIENGFQKAVEGVHGESIPNECMTILPKASHPLRVRIEPVIYLLSSAMSKPTIKTRAQELRRAGMSIRSITNSLGVSKSSVSLWCKEIPLTHAQSQKLRAAAIEAGRRGRLIGARKNREAKARIVNDFEAAGKKIANKLSSREALLIGAAVYWGEGSKVGQLSFVNSDKDMVLFMHRWFRTALGVVSDDFIPRIYINQVHRDRKGVIEAYWAHLLGLPLEQFRSTVFIHRESKKKYQNHDQYYGLLSLRVRRSTHLKYKILGLIQGLKCSTFR